MAHTNAQLEQENRVEVSVVIPTSGVRRAQLANAVHSALAQQNCGPVEVVIVDDSHNSGVQENLRRHLCESQLKHVRVVDAREDPAVGPRTVGVRHSHGKWISFLDDDDIWLPGKIAGQLSIAREARLRGELPIVSSRVRHSFEHTDAVLHGVPSRLISAGEHVSEYLFYRRASSARRESIFTSTLLVDGELARSVPWQKIRRHQDWDWLLRAANCVDARIYHHPDELVIIAVGSTSSISAGSDWCTSLKWIKGMRAQSLATPRATADFLCGQVLRYALHARSVTGVARTVDAAIATQRVPSCSAMLIGLSGLLPRTTLEALMARRATIRRHRRASGPGAATMRGDDAPLT